jgi:hypothetical protein
VRGDLKSAGLGPSGGLSEGTSGGTRPELRTPTQSGLGGVPNPQKLGMGPILWVVIRSPFTFLILQKIPQISWRSGSLLILCSQ